MDAGIQRLERRKTTFCHVPHFWELPPETALTARIRSVEQISSHGRASRLLPVGARSTFHWPDETLAFLYGGSE